MSKSSGRNRALFIDRDGTLVHARHYPSRPEDLVLYDGIADRLRDLQQAGCLLIIITNQSGIARGYFTEADLARMHDHLRDQVSKHGVSIDAIYFCPHHIDGSIQHLAINCDCRKPQPGMLQRAAADLSIDLQRSWFLGDILDDVEAGNRAGCTTILVDIGSEPPPPNRLRTPDYVASTATHAVSIVAAVEGIGPAVDLDYLPPTWRSDGQAIGNLAGKRDLELLDAGH
jgi:D-glycero-D-manno-heptose 1,7-bisphosphate phosphatase